jgi:hypothetical protein
VIYTPFFWRFIMLIIIDVPEVLFKKMKVGLGRSLRDRG